MGDLIDSVFRRQCSLAELDDREYLDRDADITVLEIGGPRAVGESNFRAPACVGCTSISPGLVLTRVCRYTSLFQFQGAGTLFRRAQEARCR